MIFKRKKYWIGVAGFWIPWLILSVLCYLFVLQPQAHRYKTVHQDFTASNDRAGIARMASFESTQKNQAQMVDELKNEIHNFVVPFKEQDQVVFEISRLANSLGLNDYAGKNLHDIWGIEETEEVKIQRVWMTITFKSDFRQFASFINAMERNAPAVYVEGASIERSREHADEHRAKLLVAFFVQPETKTSQPAFSAAPAKAEEGPAS